MATSKNRALRGIDRRPETLHGGEQPITQALDIAPPAQPTIAAPTNLSVLSADLLRSAVTPEARVTLQWRPAAGTNPTSYDVQWATNSSFTTGVGARGALEATAQIVGLATNTTYYFRVRAVRGQLQSGWSNVVSQLTPNDTTPPAAATSLVTSWSGLTGDLTMSWTNPTSTNFRDVRLRIYASNGGTLLREVYSATGRYVWTRGQHYSDTSGAYDASVYLVLAARSWSNVFAATDLTGTATLAAPSAPSGLSADFTGPECVITWTQSTAVAGYRLTIDGVARDLGWTGRYVYSLQLNAVEHSGTPDPVLTISLVAVDALGQTSSASSTTATNAAPSAPGSVSLQAFFSTLAITVTATPPRDFSTYRYRLIQTSPSAADVTWDSPSANVTRAISAQATYQLGVKVVDVFGQAGGETLSSTVAADALTLADLRASAIYSDSIGTAAATLKAALADENTGTVQAYTNPGGGAYNWTQLERSLTDRYRPISAAGSVTGAPRFYIATSLDGASWSWFAGPLTSSRVLTSYGDQATAQTNAVQFSTVGAGRVDLPSIVEARYIRIYHLAFSGTSYSLATYYPRRLVQSDDIEAESIKAINIGAGQITADKLNVSQLSAITADMGSITAGTITGATIRTSASNPRVEMTSAGLKSYTSSGADAVSILTANSGQLRLVAGIDSLLGATNPATIAWGSAAYLGATSYSDFTLGTVNDVQITADGGSGTRGRIALTAEADSGASAYLTMRGEGSGLAAGSQIQLIADDISAVGTLTATALIASTSAAVGTGSGARALTINGGAGQVRDVIYASNGSLRWIVRCENTTESGSNAGSNFQILSRDDSGNLLAALIELTRSTSGVRLGASGGRHGFYGTTPVVKPSVTGSRGGNAALASLLTALASLGLITDSTTA